MEILKFLHFEVLVLLVTIFHTNGTYRVKRRVVFQKNTKFFIRLNGKGDVLNATRIFSQAWAIRINYDLPDTISKMRNIFKRSVGPEEEESEFSTIATSCISKQICKSFNLPENNSTCGIFCGIRRIIKKSSGPQAGFLKSFLENCNLNDFDCPYNMATQGLQESNNVFHL